MTRLTIEYGLFIHKAIALWIKRAIAFLVTNYLISF